MKYKKYSYILVLVLMLVVGINKTYAIEVMFDTKMELKYSESDNKQLEVMPKHINNVTGNGETCEALFGDKDDPESIRYLINEILMYPKIIVPILVIILGTLDLAKAVIAGKEDEIKKTQTTFIKRVLIGIVIFFVPTILDIIMYLADFIIDQAMCSI